MDLQAIQQYFSSYNINFNVFLFFYFGSIVPLYGGILIIFLNVRKQNYNLKFRDVYKLKNFKLVINDKIVAGFIIFLFGVILPYLYLLFSIKKVPLIIYVIIILIIVIIIYRSICKIIKLTKSDIVLDNIDFNIKTLEIISDQDSINHLWNIYDGTFRDVNKKTPCQQSIKDAVEFSHVMKNRKVSKYIAYSNNKIIGLAVVARSVSVCTWLSEYYYNINYSASILDNKFYYFLGIAVDDKNRRSGVAKSILFHILKQLPKGAVVGFDHSLKVNRFLPSLIKIIFAGKRKVTHNVIDKQVYHIIKL